MQPNDPSRLFRALASEPLAIHRPTLDAFLSVLRRRAIEGARFDGAQLHAALGIDDRSSQPASTEVNRVAVIPIHGVIANHAHSMGFGAVDYRQVIRALARDERISAIVLDVDSPGGTVMGVPELAAEVAAAAKVKKVVAVANGMMASAAYWISSQATEIVASPSSEVGSIGVIMVHEDWSKVLEEEGVTVTEFSAGKYKSEGAPWKPLDDEARAFFDRRVTQVYDWFIADVARGRQTTPKAVREGYGEARVLPAKEAVAAGLADRVGTLEDTIERLVMKPGSSKRGMRAEQARMEADIAALDAPRFDA